MEFTGEVFHGIIYYNAISLKPIDKIFAQGFKQAQKSLLMRANIQGKQGGLKLLSDMDKTSILASGAPFVSREILL